MEQKLVAFLQHLTARYPGFQYSMLYHYPLLGMPRSYASTPALDLSMYLIDHDAMIQPFLLFFSTKGFL
jgi:hypothetical protein